MTLTKFVGILAGGLALTGSASAQGTDALSEIAQLKAEVAQLKAQNGDKWLTEERAAEIKSLVKDVLADSETRSSLQGTGATAGYSNGFFMSSADGNYKLNVGILAQARFTWNYQQGKNIGTVPATSTTSFATASGTGNGNSTWAFENRRTEFGFSGNVVDPSFTYAARFAYNSAIDPYTPTANALVLQEAWVNKDFGNGFGVKVGQFKSPFMAESLRADGASLTAERSVVDYYFSGGFTQGIMASYSQDMFRVMGSYNNGPRSQNGNWASGTNNSISLAGRVEYKAMGSWGQFDTESSAKSDESGLLIGAAIQYYNNRGGNSGAAGYLPSVNSPVYGASLDITNAVTGVSSTITPTSTGAINYTVDAAFKSGGLAINAAFVGANYGEELSLAGPVETVNSYGVVVQGGYRFTDNLEAFGRWEWYNVANGANNVASLTGADAKDVNNIITVGVNVYAGSNIKWSTQYGISLSDVSNQLINLNGAGYQPDANTQSANQMNVITQLQIMF